MTMGEKILAMRRARGWSQEELAERIEVSRQAVSRWESDGAKPDADKIVKLCTLFGVTADYLLGMPEPASQEPREPAEPQVVYVEGKSRPLLDRTSGGWCLVVLGVMAMAGYFLLEETTRAHPFCLFWLGLAGALIGIALAPAANWMSQNPGKCRGLAWCMVVAGCVTVVSVIAVEVFDLDHWREAFWPGVMLASLGWMLLGQSGREKPEE